MAGRLRAGREDIPSAHSERGRPEQTIPIGARLRIVGMNTTEGGVLLYDRKLAETSAALQTQIAESRMVLWAWSQWPVVETLGRLNRQIVDARIPMMHDALSVELPVFVAIGAIPLA